MALTRVRVPGSSGPTLKGEDGCDERHCDEASLTHALNHNDTESPVMPRPKEG
jgi:hypothetical protein